MGYLIEDHGMGAVYTQLSLKERRKIERWRHAKAGTQCPTRRAGRQGAERLGCRGAQEAHSARPADNHAALSGIRILGAQYSDPAAFSASMSIYISPSPRLACRAEANLIEIAQMDDGKIRSQAGRRL